MSHDKLVYRILSGYLRLNIENEVYIVRGNRAFQKYLAEEIYSSLRERYTYDLLSETELYDWMLSNNYWSLQEEEKLKVFRKNLEEFQVKLYELGFRGKEKQATKKAIAFTRGEIKRLTAKRHHFDFLSADGVATLEKNKYLVGLGICDNRGKPLFDEFNFFDNSFPLLDRIIIECSNQTISITEYRAMARSEPWRQYWATKESVSSIFAVPATELTEEQLNLISWTKLYDSVYQHPKCPDDSVIADDDCLDGFLIKDRRERENESVASSPDNMIRNDKIKNSEEIYMAVNNDPDIPEIYDTEPKLDDVTYIENFNDESVKAIKRQRDKIVDEKGTVRFQDFPDVQQRLQIAKNNASFGK